MFSKLRERKNYFFDTIATSASHAMHDMQTVLELPVPLVGPGPLNRLTGPLKKV